MAHNIKSKSGRLALPASPEPYWECIEMGLYIGYRKLKKGEGTWIARRIESITNKKKQHALGTYLDDGKDRAFDNARRDAAAWGSAMANGVLNKAATVSDACKSYVEFLLNNKSKACADDAKGRFTRLVYDDKIGRIQLLKLRTSDVESWLYAQAPHDEAEDEDDLRRSRDTANRNLSSLKAALNRAMKNKLVATDAGWKTVSAYKDVGRRRTDYLDKKQRQDLIKACSDDLAALVKAMLLTGARPGELAKLTVSNFDKTQSSVEFNGKTGFRIATLSDTAHSLFTEQSKNKLPTAPLLSQENGSSWDKDAWKKCYKTAAKKAKLPSSVVMYTLRHVAISEMIMGNMDSLFVAKLSGTSVAMIEKHYGHLRHRETRAKLNALDMI